MLLKVDCAILSSREAFVTLSPFDRKTNSFRISMSMTLPFVAERYEAQCSILKITVRWLPPHQQPQMLNRFDRRSAMRLRARSHSLSIATPGWQVQRLPPEKLFLWASQPPPTSEEDVSSSDNNSNWQYHETQGMTRA